MARKKIDIVFYETQMGHPDLGFMPTNRFDDPDEQDLKYERFLKVRRPDLAKRNLRVVEGAVWLDEVQH